MTRLPLVQADPRSACPKDMMFGPCGGVGADGACEVSPVRCTFVDDPVALWPGDVPVAAGGVLHAPSPAAVELAELVRARPVVISGLPARALDADSIRQCAEILHGTVDAVLAGDSGRARVQLPPAYRAHVIQEAGLRAWMGLSCRDRNRVALEGEVAALADVGVAGVHCVTGDHTLTGTRPDARPVFDMESTELVALARRWGLATSVAESPAAPPVDLRPARLAQKVAAGGELCFLQYCGDVDDVRRFIDRSREAGVTIGFVPGVPVVIDRAGAELLESFAAAVLPPGYVEGILAAPDAYQAGVAAAIDLSEQLLAIDGVVGVLPAGGPEPGTEVAFAHALASIGRALGAGEPLAPRTR
ncbi:methylenetetrahydrofolate reductase C-terminal domain-containing protein [Sanguibacter antarcticus]|uniref:Methylenetetrahydrofolate reductase n=1 Tax=Sanguibacter antarcticus TaxID=372484 RepID=A0A2A9E6C3_9MICO|nr:methylenetetrahydrofolate reductase C-terminal domain-containing protein [Sanguibacter antarcticus]PFG34393.1 5,10-methylenetetrahydrofolate reductase [Sanguibacter antarcticus]